MIRVRNLKVWFPLRRGLARELIGKASLWVRAVDGVSFDVKRGEVFCLVGESGCGKTTTGKAILRLTDATEGDVFYKMPDADYRRLEDLEGRKDDPKARGDVEELRRKYSLTWKEAHPWSLTQVLTIAGMFVAAFFLALVIPTLLAGLFADPFGNTGFLFGSGLVQGFVVGFVGVLPPTRPSRRSAAILALLAFVATLVLPVFAVAGKPSLIPSLGGFDAIGAIGYEWDQAFVMILSVCFAPAIAGGAARAITSIRSEAEGLSGIKMRTLRRHLHLVFQDPYESLNPKQSVFEIVAEPLQVNRIATDPEEVAALVSHSLEDAGLRPAEEFMFRFPHELSGGQRQRVSIAAALALEPDFIVADEPVSMLDVSIRTEILQLMMDLRKTRGLTYVFITHDLSLAWVLADRIAVMYLGKIVEVGSTEQVIRYPKHPYTQALISVVPSPDPRHRATRTILKGERPDPVDIPTGCRFHPRCPVAFEKCGWKAEEVAEEFQDAEREITTRITGAILEREAKIREIRNRQKEHGPDALALDAEVKALEKENQDLQSGRARAEQIASAVRAASPTTVVAVPPAPMTAEELATSLKSLVSAQRNARLAFKGVADITPGAGAVTVTLHPWAEPELVQVAAGNEVACHLISAPAPAPETLQAPAEPAVAQA